MHILTYYAYSAYLTYFTYFQEGHVFTCEPAPAYHRCTASKCDLLSTALFPSKSTPLRKAAIIRAASGQDLVVRGVPSRDKVVQWEEDGSDTAPGPNSSHYESVRKSVGAHLLYNAFWIVPHFCVYQMLMKDRMHAIDLGVILTLIKAMMRKYYECVEIFMDNEGLAANKLEKRFKNILATRTGPDNQR